MQAFGFSAVPPDLEPDVRALIEQRIDDLGSDADLATFIVVEPSDTLEALDAELGISVLADRNGRRFGDDGFRPPFECVESHPTFFEIVFVLEDWGDGAIVFVPKREGVDPRLIQICESYATAA